MNRNQLIDQVQFKSKIADTTMLPTADILIQLNIGYDFINSEIVKLNEDFFEQQKSVANLVANSGKYPLPTDCLKFKQLRVAYTAPTKQSDYKVATDYDPTSVQDIYSQEENASVSNPLVDLTNNYIRIKPTPLSASTQGLQIYYIARPSAITNSADAPVLPSEWHDLIATYAAKEVCLKFDQLDRWKLLNNDFNERLDKMLTALAQRNVNKQTRFRNVLETTRGGETQELY